jgi:hypothetical protein
MKSPHRRTRNSLRPRLFALSVALLTLLSSCDPGNPLIGAVADSDGDGWYDRNRNQRIELFIERIENHTGTRFADRPAIAIDSRVVVRNNETVASNVAVTSRTIGNWGAPERTDALSAQLRITTGDISTSAPTTIDFHNTNATFTKSHNDYVIHFRTVRTLFPDPAPDNAQADGDLDGLTDKEEASINSVRRAAGDPIRKDILLIVGFTHPDWKITGKSRDLLTGAFFNRGINLSIFTEPDSVHGITPGQINVNGSVPNRNHKLAFLEAQAVRPQLVRDDVSPLYHVLVLAEELNDGSFGRAEVATPANDLMCRSHLPVSGADFKEYQAKDIMHELGHNLGLCHPTESTATCPTGSIPVGERNGGLSAMGTPAESAGPIELMVEALNRPLDYTPGQWQNIDLTRLR